MNVNFKSFKFLYDFKFLEVDSMLFKIELNAVWISANSCGPFFLRGGIVRVCSHSREKSSVKCLKGSVKKRSNSKKKIVQNIAAKMTRSATDSYIRNP